jgi:hypothetical protein
MALIERLHNPGGRLCGCPPECICQRSALGRALRWYIPRRFHTGISAEEKAARLRAAGFEIGDD